MDFMGYTYLSAFPLILITALFWSIQRLSRLEIGLRFGKLKYYGLALLYPILVLGGAALCAYLYGDFSLKDVRSDELTINLVAGSLIGPIMVLLTEEGFFRGWLWGSLRRTGMSSIKVLFITSLLFTIWHISAVAADSDYGLPLKQIPIYLINATFLGLIWGMMRFVSGSIIVASVSHAVWNAFAYALFGFGENVGALGITNTAWFGPEVGYLGIALNGAFFLWMWIRFGKQIKSESESISRDNPQALF